ncbi:MAG: bifunctional pyr operon transcriptional regulator/uracil phosphoribosyltransferase PyrR [Clostridia bacterium]|nr:bifunctional pyr operon transcriptional regulator/uracil phosphoribosyltransferase PyrR [Clostridia bacterium]
MEIRFDEKVVLMDEPAMNRAICRIAHEIVEYNQGVDNLVLIGIQRRGVPLAERIAREIQHFEQIKPEIDVLDITFYRDDLSKMAAQPVLRKHPLTASIEGKTVVLVDDVIYTGRTTRAAVEALFDAGRPERVQLAVLIDRGHRELPFKPDYVGKNVPTSRSETVSVELQEIDNRNRVVLKAEVKG